MRATLTPIRSPRSVHYSASGEVLTVDLDGQIDSFDFSGLGDGLAESFETTLPICPVLSAERVGGDLTVRLLHPYGPYADESEKQEREVIIQ